MMFKHKNYCHEKQTKIHAVIERTSMYPIISLSLSAHPSTQVYIYLSIYPPTHASVYPFTYLCIYIYLPVHLSIHSPTYTSIYLSVYPSIHPSVYLLIHPSISPASHPISVLEIKAHDLLWPMKYEQKWVIHVTTGQTFGGNSCSATFLFLCTEAATF